MNYDSHAFTLIELLVVVGVVAILAVVIFIVIAPAELLRQGRDSTRLSDMDILNKGLLLYSTDIGGSMGSASTTYISIPDPSATSTAGDQCQGLGLAALPTGWSYHCAASSTYKKVDGTGWIPLNFTMLSSGAPLGTLPVDPSSQTSTNLFYTYTTDGTKYEITTIPESQKQKTAFAQNIIVTSYPDVIAQGTNLALSGIYNPNDLVGYWPFEEGSGSTTADQSSNGNAGTFAGASGGTNGHFSAGKVGTWAGAVVSGVNNLSFGTNLATFQFGNGSFSLTGWIYPTAGGTPALIGVQAGANGARYAIGYNGPSFNNTASAFVKDASGNQASAAAPHDSVPTNAWSYLTMVVDQNTKVMSFYVNGAFSSSTSISGVSGSVSPQGATVSGQVVSGAGPQLGGLVDDIRVYSRALSAAEIQALYNAEE